MANTPRGQILEEGIKLTENDRNVQYGPPVQNMQDIADLWSAYLIGKYRGTTVDENQLALTGEDVANMNVLMKMARTFPPGFKPDTYIDGAVYFAIAGECREEENRE